METRSLPGGRDPVGPAAGSSLSELSSGLWVTLPFLSPGTLLPKEDSFARKALSSQPVCHSLGQTMGSRGLTWGRMMVFELSAPPPPLCCTGLPRGYLAPMAVGQTGQGQGKLSKGEGAGRAVRMEAIWAPPRGHVSTESTALRLRKHTANARCH